MSRKKALAPKPASTGRAAATISTGTRLPVAVARHDLGRLARHEGAAVARELRKAVCAGHALLGRHQQFADIAPQGLLARPAELLHGARIPVGNAPLHIDAR